VRSNQGSRHQLIGFDWSRLRKINRINRK
jgi:hypothetical protein